MEDKFLEQKIKKLNFIVVEDGIRYELYSIFTSLILSKELLKKNSDVKAFLGEFDIEIREYLWKSRTSMLSKTLRILKDSKFNDLNKFKKKIILLFSQDDNTVSDKYINSILKKYSRNMNNE